MSPPDPNQTPARVVLYQGTDGKVTVNVLFALDNFWLTQKALAEIFGVKTPAVNKHLKNIYESGELSPAVTISKMETVQTEGVRSRLHPPSSDSRPPPPALLRAPPTVVQLPPLCWLTLNS